MYSWLSTHLRNPLEDLVVCEPRHLGLRDQLCREGLGRPRTFRMCVARLESGNDVAACGLERWIVEEQRRGHAQPCEAGDLIAKLDLLGKDLREYSLDTVKQFYDDGQRAGYRI